MTDEGTGGYGLPIIATFDSGIAAEQCLADLKAAGFADRDIRIISDDEKARLANLGLSDNTGTASASIPPDSVSNTVIAQPLAGAPVSPVEPGGEHNVVEGSSSPLERGFRAGMTMVQIAVGSRKNEAAEIVRKAAGNIESPLITHFLLSNAKQNPDPE
jgi:hypothetical protein